MPHGNVLLPAGLCPTCPPASPSSPSTSSRKRSAARALMWCMWRQRSHARCRCSSSTTRHCLPRVTRRRQAWLPRPPRPAPTIQPSPGDVIKRIHAGQVPVPVGHRDQQPVAVDDDADGHDPQQVRVPIPFHAGRTSCWHQAGETSSAGPGPASPGGQAGFQGPRSRRWRHPARTPSLRRNCHTGTFGIKARPRGPGCRPSESEPGRHDKPGTTTSASRSCRRARARRRPASARSTNNISPTSAASSLSVALRPAMTHGTGADSHQSRPHLRPLCRSVLAQTVLVLAEGVLPGK